ncbi:MAG: ribonuclease PH [Actinomycetia bacterium]|nr:ribonuclease PH [Actinomycetes bacterium]
MTSRINDRAADALRPVTIERNVSKNAYGSAFIRFGDTQVLCTATIEDNVPGWRKMSGLGWVTAEYAMLPTATGTRTRRERGGARGRTLEIERLIGRSLRTVVDLGGLGGEATVTVDCDVIQADGGTRTASITGAYIALHDALATWKEAGMIASMPLTGQVAAVSVGLVDGEALLDLDYEEDSHAEVDMNVVCDDQGNFIELQGTGERISFSRHQLNGFLNLAESGIKELMRIQKEVLAGE